MTPKSLTTLEIIFVLQVAFCLLPFVCHLSSPLLIAYPDGWSDDIQVSVGDDKSRYNPDIAADSYNNVWVVYDTVTWVSGTGEILYTKRDSLGNCLIPETPVSNNPSYSIHPRIVVDGSDNVHFIWRDATPQGLGLWYAKLANEGSTIVPSRMAVSGAGGLGISTEIALDKYQRINIAWEEVPGSDRQISYTKLDSLGNAIITKIRVTLEGVPGTWVGIGVDSSANSHLACRTDSNGSNFRLTYSKLDNEGTFLVSNKVLATGGNPAMACDRHQNIHMAYCNPAGPGNRIDYLKLDNDGNILVGPQTISSPQIFSNCNAHMTIDSRQCLHVVWEGTASDSTHIWYCKLDTLGGYLTLPMKIVYPYEAGAPRIAVDGNDRLHVVWIDVRLGPEGYIFYKRGENEESIKESSRHKISAPFRITMSPNPFSNTVAIRYEIPAGVERREKGTSSIGIYDVTGKMVKSFDPLPHAPSSLQISWNGTDQNGRNLPSGVYFVKLEADQFPIQEKILLVR